LLSNHEILFVVLNKPRDPDSVPADELMDKALQLNWPMCGILGGVDTKLAAFSNMILDFYNGVLPPKLIKDKKKFRPQLPETIKASIKKRDSLRKLAFRTGHH
jgi:hypothetical protein